MINAKQTIQIQGEGVELLITPSMYKASLTRGLDITLHDENDEGEIWEIYVKLVYLAYRNALDVAAFDGNPAPKREFDMLDFQLWAVGEGKERFAELVRDIVYLKTGKTIDELCAEGKKKAKPKPRRIFRFWSRGNRDATGS